MLLILYFSREEGETLVVVYFVYIQVVAHVEAVIDFGEDENIEDGVMDEGQLSIREL